MPFVRTLVYESSTVDIDLLDDQDRLRPLACIMAELEAILSDGAPLQLRKGSINGTRILPSASATSLQNPTEVIFVVHGSTIVSPPICSPVPTKPWRSAPPSILGAASVDDSARIRGLKKATSYQGDLRGPMQRYQSFSAPGFSEKQDDPTLTAEAHIAYLLHHDAAGRPAIGPGVHHYASPRLSGGYLSPPLSPAAHEIDLIKFCPDLNSTSLFYGYDTPPSSRRTSVAGSQAHADAEQASLLNSDWTSTITSSLGGSFGGRSQDFFGELSSRPAEGEELQRILAGQSSFAVSSARSRSPPPGYFPASSTVLPRDERAQIPEPVRGGSDTGSKSSSRFGEDDVGRRDLAKTSGSRKNEVARVVLDCHKPEKSGVPSHNGSSPSARRSRTCHNLHSTYSDSASRPRMPRAATERPGTPSRRNRPLPL